MNTNPTETNIQAIKEGAIYAHSHSYVDVNSAVAVLSNAVILLLQALEANRRTSTPAAQQPVAKPTPVERWAREYWIVDKMAWDYEPPDCKSVHAREVLPGDDQPKPITWEQAWVRVAKEMRENHTQRETIRALIQKAIALYYGTSETLSAAVMNALFGKDK